MLAIVVSAPTPVPAQTGPDLPLTRSQAVERAMARGPRLGIARADTAVAFAQLLTARAFQNPTLVSEYTKSKPRFHLSAELPFDYPWLRKARIRTAETARLAARHRFELERAVIALDADTTYTRAVASSARARLSRRTADDADSLRRMVVARRDAGDASDLDVELALVNAGQQANLAAADSLALISNLLDLQTLIGLDSGQVAVTLVDSLTVLPVIEPGTPVPAPLGVAAAELSLESASFAVRAQRRSLFAATSITAGFETGDPSGDEPGVLPLVGISIPLPFLTHNRGPIALAEAERDRAESELELARLEARIRISRAERERTIALAKVDRDRRLVTSANRVAALALTAYREGASSLPNVLEAQRNAREILAQYVDDLASVWIANAALRVYRLAPSTGGRP
jgi:cobalt-zinc-cadmium efflux system outer membrane protein